MLLTQLLISYASERPAPTKGCKNYTKNFKQSITREWQRSELRANVINPGIVTAPSTEEVYDDTQGVGVDCRLTGAVNAF